MQEVREQLVQQFQRTQEKAERRAQRLVSQLQQEVIELQRSRQELELLRQSQDHLHLVQVRKTFFIIQTTSGDLSFFHKIQVCECQSI